MPSTQAQAPNTVLGQIVGSDISVIGPSTAAANSSIPTIEFGSGVTIVVHSGKARVEFTGGGELDVCGPAKFTVLSSDQALTVALSFGRVHARFDALRPIVIYSPMTVATPLSLGDQPRDATIGLTNTGAMCVLATHGAVRLQNQLTGEATIVPQPSEVLVPSASFANLPPAAGQCRCDFDEPTANLSSPLAAQTPSAKPQTASPQPQSSIPSPGPSAAQHQNPAAPAPPSPVVPRDETVAHPKIRPSPVNRTETPVPAVPSPRPPVAPVAPDATFATEINLPPIGYDARSATVTSEPLSVATLMLAQETVVQPGWIFHGTVIEAGKGGKNAPASGGTQSLRNAQKPKKTFWQRFLGFLTGHSS